MGRYNFNQRTRDGYEISPEQAAKWLERNDNNRNVNVAKVKKMAKDMREGHWDTTHQGIAIASDGTLVDGQHRLLAIVESGVTVRMNVTFNAAKSQHIDSGNIHSMANRYCQKVFHLDGYEDYFIKTGTYSSKYEFRNAHIHNPKEINEMGEYFLFLNHLTCSMASPLNNRCFYGANTTNEWVVREYIKDKENNPTIYNGLPLHTEYRVFVDFDTKEILGASPYWRSDVMKNEFKKVSSPQERHDYVVYKMHEDILNQRYHESVQTVLAELKKVIPRIELTGQWSVDVMRNGNDYYIIDMALAENSALNDCVPKNLLRAYPQQWLPGESNS